MIDSWVGHQTDAMRRRYTHLFPHVQHAAIAGVFGAAGGGRLEVRGKSPLFRMRSSSFCEIIHSRLPPRPHSRLWALIR